MAELIKIQDRNGKTVFLNPARVAVIEQSADESGIWNVYLAGKPYAISVTEADVQPLLKGRTV